MVCTRCEAGVNHFAICGIFLLLRSEGRVTPLPSLPPIALSDVLPGPAASSLSLPQVRLSDGGHLDSITFHRDFIHLNHHNGVSLYEDMLAVLAVSCSPCRLMFMVHENV